MGTMMPRKARNLTGLSSLPCSSPFRSSWNQESLPRLLMNRLLRPRKLSGILSANVGYLGKFRVAVVKAEKYDPMAAAPTKKKARANTMGVACLSRSGLNSSGLTNGTDPRARM